jgi:hypothetical protein
LGLPVCGRELSLRVFSGGQRDRLRHRVGGVGAGGFQIRDSRFKIGDSRFDSKFSSRFKIQLEN